MQGPNLKDRIEHEIERIHELEEKLADPAVTGDPALLKQYSSEHNRLSPRLEPLRHYLQVISQIEESKQILEDRSADPELKEMAKEELASLENELQTSQKQIHELLIPPDPNEGRGVIVEIRAGTGGEEAALFVGDLYNMYANFAEKKGLTVEPISSASTELGGFKEIIFSLSGPDAYSLFHQEGGGHRVQRIPVTESGGRIHTSAVTVAVLIEAEEEEIDINDQDLRIDVYRASGAGGQHVNKTESAVRVTHIPSGIVVACQDERSQIKNRARAMKVLRARLAEMQQRERHEREAAAKKEQVGSGDRSERIRTYNFPQGRVTDHRIGFTSYNLNGFMEGEMDELLEALLDAEKEKKLANL